MSEDANTRRALLIGINEYPNLEERYRLRGCVNDTELMGELLRERFGFRAENVARLRDRDATREAILAALARLESETRAGDTVVLHYSGHGSQMTDREGDEPDGLDETILPSDTGRGEAENRDITDDEIRLWLLRLTEKTHNVTLVFDCCHSGTLTRDPFGAASRWVEPDLRPAHQLPPSPLAAQHGALSTRGLGAGGWLPLGSRYVLLAGCRDEESSFEYYPGREGEAEVCGAFTYFLCRELWRAEAGSTYRDVFERAAVSVSAEYPRQHPQLEGARDRELFGARDLSPMRFVPVRQRDSEAVTLGGGGAHGVTVGSLWAVYPQATKRVTAETPRLGTIELVQVRAVTSEARVIAESHAGAIEANSRAVEESRAFGATSLAVELPEVSAEFGTEATELRRLVEESPLLTLAGAGEQGEVCLRLVLPRKEVKPGDVVPQLGPITEAVWAAVGEGGRLRVPLQRAGAPRAAAKLLDNLEKLARHSGALKIVNPGGLSGGKVKLTLLRQRTDGSWEEAAPAADGLPVYEEGERIGFRVFNETARPVFISLLDFGLTGAINLLYPTPGANEVFTPSRSVGGADAGGDGPNVFDIGVQDGDEIELFLPEDFPFVMEPGERQPAGGVETVKLLVTTHEADFSWLEQSEYVRSRNLLGLLQRRSGRPPSTPEWLMAAAVSGVGARDAKRKTREADEEWTTVEQRFELRRRRV